MTWHSSSHKNIYGNNSLFCHINLYIMVIDLMSPVSIFSAVSSQDEEDTAASKLITGNRLFLFEVFPL